MANLLKQFTDASSAANQASLGQYKNLMRNARGTKKDVLANYPKMMNLAGSFGQTGMADIEEARQNQRAMIEQDAVTRGIGNTTIRQNMLGGADQAALRAQQGLGESVNRQKLDILQGKVGSQLDLGHLLSNAIQARQNEGPDMSAYLSIIQQLAASQAGAGGGAAGGGGGGFFSRNLGR